MSALPPHVCTTPLAMLELMMNHCPVERPEDRDVGLAVAVVVARHRDVRAAAPRLHDPARRARVDDEPLPGRGPEDRDVGLAVAVVVARHRDVRAAAPRLHNPARHARVDDEPVPGRGPEDGDVGLAVAVEVAAESTRDP